jgi:hypothetical protein
MQRDRTPARQSNSASTPADAAGSQAADHPGHEDLRKAGVMTGYHTGWACPPEQPERIAIRGEPAVGTAIYDQPHALGLSVADLARRADTTTDKIKCIEQGGTGPAIALLRRPAC